MSNKRTSFRISRLGCGIALVVAAHGALACSDGSTNESEAVVAVPLPSGQEGTSPGENTSPPVTAETPLGTMPNTPAEGTPGASEESPSMGGSNQGGAVPANGVEPGAAAAGGKMVTEPVGVPQGGGGAANNTMAGAGGIPAPEVAPVGGSAGEANAGAPGAGAPNAEVPKAGAANVETPPAVSPPVAPIADYAPIGFASIEAWGQNGTTGGYGGPTVTVSTTAEFLDHIGKEGPYTIMVDGVLSLPSGMHQVSSDKTIVGVGASSGITGGGLNVGLSITQATEPPPDAVHNVIIANLDFSGANDDCINVQMFSHHVWMHHNTFSQSGDGTLDIKRGSSYCTVSYNHFKQTRKTLLLGHSDGNGAQDIGHLKTTYHHNWFEGGRSRHPRVRFAEAHVFNNFYDNLTNYGIAKGNQSLVYSENNFCDGGRCVGGPGGGKLKDVGSVGISGSDDVGWQPSDYYSYTPDPADAVPDLVKAGAGHGKPGAMPPP